MSKRTWLKSLLVAGGLSAMILPFQNCGPGGLQSADHSSITQMSVHHQDPVLDPPVIKVQTVTTTYDPILADRRYLRSVFTDVFGPRTDALTQIRRDALNHGALCGVYAYQFKLDTDGKRTSTPVDDTEVCGRASASRTIAQVNPKSAAARQSLLTKACSDLTNDATAFDFALKRISSQAPAILPEANKENMLKVFRLFYRFRSTPPDGLLESLQLMVPASGATKDDWRTVVYSVCASGLWQVL